MSHACAMSVSPSPLLAPEPRVSRVESVWLTALSPAPSTTWYPVGFRSKEGLCCGGGIPDPGWEFLQHGSPQRILDMAFPPWWPCTFIPEAEGWTRWPLQGAIPSKAPGLRCRRLKGQERQEPDPLGAESGCFLFFFLMQFPCS